MEIAAATQVTAGLGHYQEADTPTPVLDIVDARTGEPVRIFLDDASAYTLLLSGMQNWLTPRQRADILRRFVA